MAKNKSKKSLNCKKFTRNNGFGLVDAIVSVTLLAGVIAYGIYFSSVRLGTVYNSNLTNAINKEIERDIERLKSDFWGLFFEESEDCKGGYCLSNGQPISQSICSDFTQDIVDLDSWNIEKKSTNAVTQSWRPGSRRSKVLSQQPVTISRTLTIQAPLNEQYLNKTIASISYRVQWLENNIHWLNISISPEAHSWCEHLI